MKLVALAFALAACTGHGSGSIDQVIGAGCVQDKDCATRCYLDQGQGNRFPGGFCSQPCTSNAQCPGDAVCVDAAGGVCMFACPQFNCANLGVGWHCADQDLVGGGKAQVCTGD